MPDRRYEIQVKTRRYLRDASPETCTSAEEIVGQLEYYVRLLSTGKPEDIEDARALLVALVAAALAQAHARCP